MSGERLREAGRRGLLAGGLGGRTPRGLYALVGTSLVALKHGLDRALAHGFDRRWSYLDYWAPSSYDANAFPGREWPFLVSLLALSLPFLLVGLYLTLRRLRDSGLPAALLVLFFVPVVNLLFFAMLCLVPPKDAARTRFEPPPRLARLLPASRLAAAIAAVVLTALVALGLVTLTLEAFETYGWSLFVAAPFALGFFGALIHEAQGARPLRESLGIATTAVVVTGAALALVAIEGLVCIVMALPLAIPLALLGAVAGHAVLGAGGPRGSAPAAAACLALLPFLLAYEGAIGRDAPVQPVRTSIVVDAPPETVWRRVIAFPELDPPRELAFRAGVAFPVGATIEGEGVGAVRRCRFSTGDFVEPITVWDAPRVLRFAVTAQPPPLRELSPWGEIHPPHLDGFLLSREGEFRLEPLPGGRTLLIGTTWYENRMWPQPYWRAWSDGLIHRIHLRVLRHVAALAEAVAAASQWAPAERTPRQFATPPRASFLAGDCPWDSHRLTDAKGVW